MYVSLQPTINSNSRCFCFFVPCEDSEGYNHLEFLLGSLRHAEALVDHFVGEDENGLINSKIYSFLIFYV